MAKEEAIQVEGNVVEALANTQFRVELENGQYCAYPNNRLRIIDTSLSPKQLLVPDFKCSTHFFAVENEIEAKTYGDTDAYHY